VLLFRSEAEGGTVEAFAGHDTTRHRKEYGPDKGKGSGVEGERGAKRKGDPVNYIWGRNREREGRGASVLSIQEVPNRQSINCQRKVYVLGKKRTAGDGR